MKNTAVDDLLRNVHPFRFLRDTQRRELGADCRWKTVNAGETVFRRGDVDDTVFLVARGTVDIVEPQHGVDAIVSVIGANQYFGEWEAIFHEPRLYGARARTDCAFFSITGDRFRQVLRDSPSCAQGFGTVLRDNQGIFAGFDRFIARLLKEADEGHINVDGLLPLYRALQPAIHPGATEDHRLDGAALQYAVRRLPDNVTQTFAFLLVDEFPHAFDDAGRLFPTIRSAGRRRDVWEMMRGKDMVLLRNGRSDLIDLVTCLCLYAVEACKMRERLVRDHAIPRLRAFLDIPEQKQTDADLIDTLPFSSREARGILAAWPQNTVQRLYEVTRHREMFSIDVRRQRKNYNMRRGEFWTAEVARGTRELIGFDPTEIPRERGVHIVSSNTHSVTNCLNPWFPVNAEHVLQWGAARKHPALSGTWTHRSDQVYALAREFFVAHPDAAREARVTARKAGQFWLDETASTGIQVQLIDLNQLRGSVYDSEVHPIGRRSDPGSASDFVVNIDYAFGHQAEYIIRNLLMLFGENVRSVSLLGKAGALLGKRGDILIPTAFIEQQADHFLPLPTAQRGLGKEIEERFPVHYGPMLTVEGTLLQNRQMLSFYREIWDVVAMEMEGAHYYREILESQQLGVVSREVTTRFLYYISDLPLDAHSGLTVPLAPVEGVPPLYAITRSILNQIVSGGTV